MIDMAASPSFLGIALPHGADALAASFEIALIESVSIAVVDALPASKLAQFEAVLAGGDAEDIGAFLELYVPKARDIIGPITDDMRESLGAFAPAGI